MNEPQGNEEPMRWLGDDPEYDEWAERVAKENLQHQVEHDAKISR